MHSIMKISEYISRLTIPYKDIFTTVYTIKTRDGVLVFDAGSFDEDAQEYVLPFFKEMGIDGSQIKYVFISHNHKDHAGGLKGFMKLFPHVCILTKSPELKEAFSSFNVLIHNDNDVFLEVLKVVTIPGHTQDSCGILDTRTNTLISGDSLQLYGIIGSGNWASNINFPTEHIEAIDKLRGMNIERIYTAHDYYPYGYEYLGQAAVSKALDACIEPLEKIKTLISENAQMSDEEVSALYNKTSKTTLGSHVVAALRKGMQE